MLVHAVLCLPVRGLNSKTFLPHWVSILRHWVPCPLPFQHAICRAMSASSVCHHSISYRKKTTRTGWIFFWDYAYQKFYLIYLIWHWPGLIMILKRSIRVNMSDFCIGRWLHRAYSIRQIKSAFVIACVGKKLYKCRLVFP